MTLLTGVVLPGKLLAENAWATDSNRVQLQTHPIQTNPPNQPVAGQWRTVPQTRFRSSPGTTNRQSVVPQRPGWNLQWRRSPLATDDQQNQISRDAYQRHSATVVDEQDPTQLANASQPASHDPGLPNQPLQRATWLVSPSHPDAPEHAVARTAAQIELPEASGFPLPEANASPQAGLPNSEAPSTAPEWFENPFREESRSASDPAGSTLPGAETIPAPEPIPDGTGSPAMPQDTIRGMLDDSIVDQPRSEVEDLAPPTQSPADAGAMEALEAAPDSPSDLGFGEINPFDQQDGDPGEGESDVGIDFQVGLADVDSGTGLTCDEFRRRIQADTIDKLSLDISPPFRPDIIDQSEFERLKSKFDDGQESRTWRDLSGKPLATGRLSDLAYEKAVILTEFGSSEEVPLDRLSEPDRIYISENWGLPNECVLPQVAYQARDWHPLTMTYMASNLCHKPLYFEEVNLERYGHTAGPLGQPIISSAHFFLNIAVLPYKMGVHSPHECQYALGYYRPGNCAPWIIPPVPISLKGALYQAAAVATTAALVP